MNVAETRAEMLGLVADLREQIAAVDPAQLDGLVAKARRRIERSRKRFKRRIDERANQRSGFSIHAREGIEQKLAEITAEAMAAVTAVAGESPKPGEDPNPARAPDGPAVGVRV